LNECLAWQQFIYSSSQGLFLEYWLLNYTPKPDAGCPDGWTPYINKKINCYKDSPKTQGILIPEEKLGATSMDVITSNGGDITLVLTTYKGTYKISAPDLLGLGLPDQLRAGHLYAAPGWKMTEFNFFGDGNGSKGTFADPSSTWVNVTGDYYNGAYNVECLQGTLTGESNNLVPGGCSPSSLTSIKFLEGTKR
jgi:hypothetical protein